MKKYIEAIKKIDKSVFSDPVLRPFKDLEIVLRGIGGDFNAVSIALTNPYVWSPYDRAVKKIHVLLQEIDRIEYDDPILREGMEVIAPALTAVFDNRVIITLLARRVLKSAMKKIPKELSERITAIARPGPVGNDRYVNNFYYDFLIDNEVFTSSISLPTVNNFKHYFEMRDKAISLFPVNSITDGITGILSDKNVFMRKAKID